MTTALQVCQQAKNHLMGGLRERLNFLTGLGLNVSDTGVLLEDAVTDIKVGMLVEVDRELMYVRAVDEGAKSLTVRRGMDNTDPTSHNGDTQVIVNPIYSMDELFRHLQQEVSLLNGTGICQFEAFDLTYSATTRTYDLTEMIDADTHLIDVHNVTFESDTAGTSGHRPVRWRLHRHREVSDFASSFGLEIVEGGRHGYPLRVVVKRSMAIPDRLSATLDVPEEAIAALAPGVTWRTLLGQEARRTNPRVESGSRRAEEVPVQSNAFAARAFQAMREDAIAAALEVQLRKYPVLRRD